MLCRGVMAQQKWQNKLHIWQLVLLSCDAQDASIVEVYVKMRIMVQILRCKTVKLERRHVASGGRLAGSGCSQK